MQLWEVGRGSWPVLATQTLGSCCGPDRRQTSRPCHILQAAVQHMWTRGGSCHADSSPAPTSQEACCSLRLSHFW